MADPSGLSSSIFRIAAQPEAENNAAPDEAAGVPGSYAVLEELSKTRPSGLVRSVAQHPAVYMLLTMALAICLAIPIALSPPGIDTSFESLTIKDHPVVLEHNARITLEEAASAYWSLDLNSQARRRLQSTFDESSDDTYSYVSSTHQALEQLIRDSTIAYDNKPRRHLLQQGINSVRPMREYIEFGLHVVYRRNDKGSMLDADMVTAMKSVEDEIFALQGYQELCVHNPLEVTNGRRVCRRPIAFTNYVYGSYDPNLGGFVPHGDSIEQQDPLKVARLMASANITYAFDKDVDLVTGYAATMRAEYIFGFPGDGIGLDKVKNEEAYLSLCKRMYAIFKREETDQFRINFGGEVMTDWEITSQLLHDVRYAAIAGAIALVMLIIVTQSIFITVVGLLQILVSFPVAYNLYAWIGGYGNLGIIHFLAPFVIIGIGLDDIFVFVSIYSQLLPFSKSFAVETRLQVAYSRASGSILATSATSAIAFAANIISPLPAVKVFGLLLAMLVIVNYLAAITWLPACIVFWDRYLRQGCFFSRVPNPVLQEQVKEIDMYSSSSGSSETNPTTGASFTTHAALPPPPTAHPHTTSNPASILPTWNHFSSTNNNASVPTPVPGLRIQPWSYLTEESQSDGPHTPDGTVYPQMNRWTSSGLSIPSRPTSGPVAEGAQRSSVTCASSYRDSPLTSSSFSISDPDANDIDCTIRHAPVMSDAASSALTQAALPAAGASSGTSQPQLTDTVVTPGADHPASPRCWFDGPASGTYTSSSSALELDALAMPRYTAGQVQMASRSIAPAAQFTQMRGATGNGGNSSVNGGAGAPGGGKHWACCGTPYARRYLWGKAFDLAWMLRYGIVAMMLIIAAVASLNASRLQPADAVPAVFPKDHNVQYFLELWANNYTSNQVLQCQECINERRAISLPGTVDPVTPLSPPPSPDTMNTTDVLPSNPADSPSLPNVSGGLAAALFPPPPTPTPPTIPGDDTSDPTETGSTREDEGDSDIEAPTPPPPPPPSPVASSAVPANASDTARALAAINVDYNDLEVDTTRENSIRAVLLWGVASIQSASSTEDPFADGEDKVIVTLDYSFDIRDASQQFMVAQILGDLFTDDGKARASRTSLASVQLGNVLDGVRAYCADKSSRDYCSRLDSRTGLPTGAAFDSAVYYMLEENFSLEETRDFKRQIGYSFEDADVGRGLSRSRFSPKKVPKVRWLAIPIATAVLEVAKPGDIFNNYNEWQTWAADVQEGESYTGMRVTAEKWISAVTEDEIVNSVAWSIGVSTVCAIIAVYVFTGNIIVTALASLTMVCINVFMLGLYHMLGWTLGAIEGISITVLVGLSVDFSIHLSDAFVNSTLETRRERARDAVQWMGTPVLSSALSTVLAALPLSLTTLVVLNRFAVIMAASMAASCLYSFLLLMPLLGMVGRQRPRSVETRSKLSNFWSHRSNRAGVCCMLLLTLVVCFSQGRELYSENMWLPGILLAVSVASLANFVLHWYRNLAA